MIKIEILIVINIGIAIFVIRILYHIHFQANNNDLRGAMNNYLWNKGML